MADRSHDLLAACIVFVSQYDPLSEEAGLNVCLEACSDQTVRLLWAGSSHQTFQPGQAPGFSLRAVR